MRAWRPVGGPIIGLAVLASLALSAPALAADTYVDGSLGSDANLCINPASPCATVGAAIGKAGTNDTVHVAPGTYAEQLTLANGKSLDATGTPASTVIAPSASPTINVTAAAGTIDGFSIRTVAAGTAVQLGAPATLRGNVFDTNAGGALGVDIGPGADGASVTNNSFIDDAVGSQTAVRSGSTGAATTITANRIDGHSNGVALTVGSPTIRGNVITGIHGGGAGINVFPTIGDSTPLIVGNYIHDFPAGNTGIQIFDSNQADTIDVGATLERNRIDGGSTGVLIAHQILPVTMDSDIVTGTANTGIGLNDTPAVPEVSLTNVTAWGNVAADITLTDASATIDSSIVEGAIARSGGTSCGITFSRGPTTTGPSSCDAFTTTVAPAFVSATDFHLQAASPMIDQGNTAAPTATADIDGDPRAVDSSDPCNSTGSERRDIGADEYRVCGVGGVTIISPAASATTGASPSFTFSGSGSPALFRCSMDGAAFAACSSPKGYEGLANGAHTFVVMNVGLGGNAQPVTRAFNVDGSSPDSEILAGPAEGSTSGPNVSLTFSSEPGATYQCSLDGATFSTCTTPLGLSGLADGSHKLIIRSVDGVGDVDTSPVVRSWAVDATPPETTIDSGPADGAVTAGNVTYGFSSEPGATFECALDGAAFAACTSPRALTGLAGGPHTFAVRATDTFGNVDATPASRSLTLVPEDGNGSDTKAPTTTIKKIKVKGDKAKVKFKADEAASFTCRLDKGRFKPCKSPRIYKHLDTGKHKVFIRATDKAGNVEKKPVKGKFKIQP